MDMNQKRYTLGLYEKAMPEVSWPEKLRIAKDAGYDFFDENAITQLKPTVVERWNGEELMANRIDYIKSTQDDYHKGYKVNVNLLDLEAYSLDIEKIKKLRR